jgi:protein-S-isoprenylcysteine O-methyltransferase Ste14
MARPLIPLLNTILFTVLVPGTVAGYVPYLVLGGYRGRAQGPLFVFGAAMIGLGAAIYFRCAWEFAVRGLGTPAPIAPTKYLVTTALHRYVRNPMYIGVGLAILGQASLFGSLRVAGYGALVLLVVHLSCSLLRGTDSASTVWGVLQCLPPFRSAMDSQVAGQRETSFVLIIDAARALVYLYTAPCSGTSSRASQSSSLQPQC